MKILYFFQELDTPMFQWQRDHFIEELSHHRIIIDTFNPLLFSSVEEANEKLVAKARNGDYDLFISNMGYYKMLYVETLDAIKRMGIPTLRIAWDNLMIPFIDRVLSPHFDLVWLTSKETQRLYNKWGANSFFAPYAANPFTFTYQKPQTINRHACFVGNPHGSRAIMINHLTENGLDVDLFYGQRKEGTPPHITLDVKYDTINPSTRETLVNRIKFAEGRRLLMGSLVNKMKGHTIVANNKGLHRFSVLSHKEMVSTYSSSVLSLSSSSAGHTDVLKKPLKIVNLRNFEIPMCGGLQLCKYSDELASYFEDCKEIILYKTDEELIERARYFIEKVSDAELFKLKEAARRRAENDHTWWNRFTRAFDILGLNYEK